MSSDRDSAGVKPLLRHLEIHRLRVLHWEGGSECVGPVSVAWSPVPCTSSTVCTHERKRLNLCISLTQSRHLAAPAAAGASTGCRPHATTG